MSNVFRGPSKDASYQVSIYLAKWFQRRRFLEVNQSETRIACGGNVFTNLDEMSNLYRGPSYDASYQVSIHFSKRFQRKRFFRNQPIRNKNGLWEYMSNRSLPRCPHFYQNTPTFYQNAPTIFFRIKIILPKRPHFFIAKNGMFFFYFSTQNDDIMCDVL